MTTQQVVVEQEVLAELAVRAQPVLGEARAASAGAAPASARQRERRVGVLDHGAGRARPPSTPRSCGDEAQRVEHHRPDGRGARDGAPARGRASRSRRAAAPPGTRRAASCNRSALGYVTLPAKLVHQPRSITSSSSSARRSSAARRGRRMPRSTAIVSAAASRVWITTGSLSRLGRQLDLPLERRRLRVVRRSLAVEVEAALADRRPREGRGSARASSRPHLGVPLRRPDGGAVRPSCAGPAWRSQSSSASRASSGESPTQTICPTPAAAAASIAASAPSGRPCRCAWVSITPRRAATRCAGTAVPRRCRRVPPAGSPRSSPTPRRCSAGSAPTAAEQARAGRRHHRVQTMPSTRAAVGERPQRLVEPRDLLRRPRSSRASTARAPRRSG